MRPFHDVHKRLYKIQWSCDKYSLEPKSWSHRPPYKLNDDQFKRMLTVESFPSIYLVLATSFSRSKYPRPQLFCNLNLGCDHVIYASNANNRLWNYLLLSWEHIDLNLCTITRNHINQRFLKIKWYVNLLHSSYIISHNFHLLFMEKAHTELKCFLTW